MVPARNLLRRHYDSYGGGGGYADLLLQEEKTSSSLLISFYPMAEEEEEEAQRRRQQEQEAGTTSSSSSRRRRNSKEPVADDSWLQLGIGSPAAAAASTTTSPPRSLQIGLFSSTQPINAPPPGSAAAAAAIATAPPQPMPMPVIFAPRYGGFGHRGQWGYWSSTTSSSSFMMGGGSSTSSSPPPPPPSQATQYFTNSQQYVGSTSSTSTELRVISPPTRRQAGVWFLLQATKNQVREPFLPQIAKSYLRIKDGRMTVRLLMKYLVNKLGLEDELEVEISCRGQLLPPHLTLQYVRDNIWCLREAAAFLSDPPSDHVMTLQYGRSHR